MTYPFWDSLHYTDLGWTRGQKETSPFGQPSASLGGASGGGPIMLTGSAESRFPGVGGARNLPDRLPAGPCRARGPPCSPAHSCLSPLHAHCSGWYFPPLGTGLLTSVLEPQLLLTPGPFHLHSRACPEQGRCVQQGGCGFLPSVRLRVLSSESSENEGGRTPHWAWKWMKGKQGKHCQKHFPEDPWSSPPSAFIYSQSGSAASGVKPAPSARRSQPRAPAPGQCGT